MKLMFSYEKKNNFLLLTKSGIKPIDKKDGAGKGNWGTPEDEIVAELVFAFLFEYCVQVLLSFQNLINILYFCKK